MKYLVQYYCRTFIMKQLLEFCDAFETAALGKIFRMRKQHLEVNSGDNKRVSSMLT